MNNIDIFFKFLKNAKKKGREVGAYDYHKTIYIYANGKEGNGIVAKIENGSYTEEIWYGFLGLRQKYETTKWISGYFVDVKTLEYHHFCIKDTDDNYAYYLNKLQTAVSECKNKNIGKKDRNFKNLLKREL